MKSVFPKLALSVWPFVHRPYILLYNVTQRCNLRCSYCFGQYYSDPKELTLAESKKVLAQFYQLGVRRLGLGGGEPLLYKDIDELIRFAVTTGFDVGLNTNGILVPQHISSLKLLSNLSISIDGADSQVHDKYRGQGSFNKAMEGVDAAFKAGIPLNFCCTLTDANIDEWPKILLLAQKYKAHVELSPLYCQFRGGAQEGFPQPLTEERWQREIARIIEAKKKDKSVFFSSATYKMLQDWPYPDRDTSPCREKGHPRCLAGKKFLTMDAQANLFPCVRVSTLVPGKNCLELGVREAYEGLSAAPCKSCRWACYIEYNSLLNFSLKSLCNFVQQRFLRS